MFEYDCSMRVRPVWHKVWEHLDLEQKAILDALRDLDELTSGGRTFKAAYNSLDQEMREAYDTAFKGGKDE